MNPSPRPDQDPPGDVPHDGVPAEEAPPDSDRGPPVSGLRAPLLGGTVVGTALLILLSAASAHLEGGATPEERRTNAWAQAAVLLVAAGVLGFYARRVLLCAHEDDRRVPFGRDERDPRPWTSDVAAFVAVAFLSFLPLVAWTVVGRAVGAPAWASVAVSSASLVYATAVFPFAHAAVVMRGTILAGTPSVALRAIRSSPVAARAAITPTFTFLALLSASMVMSGWFTPPPDGAAAIEDHTAGRDLLRVAVFLVRSAAAWAALASFRAVGLLAREVPEVGEVLR